MMLLNHLRTGGEETEAAILAKYIDRTRYPLSVLTAWAVNEPSPAATRLRRMGIEIDEGAHALSSMESKADYIARKIRRDGIRIVIACQDTKLAHHVFEQLRPDECRLIEHAGIEAEVGRIPKAFTSRLVGVSPAIARAAVRHFPDQPERVRYLPSMVDVADYWGQDRASLRDAYNFGSDIVITFVGRMDAKKGITHLLDAAAAAASRSSQSPLPGRRPGRCVSAGARGAAAAARANGAAGESLHLRGRTRRRLADPHRVGHLRAAVARRRHVARDQRSRRGGTSGRGVRRWRGGAAARWRRGGRARAAGRYGAVRRGAAHADRQTRICARGSAARCGRACSTNSARSASFRAGRRCSTRSLPICRARACASTVRVRPRSRAAAVPGGDPDRDQHRVQRHLRDVPVSGSLEGDEAGPDGRAALRQDSRRVRDRADGVAAGAVPQQRAVHRRAHGRLDRDGQSSASRTPSSR